MRAYQSVQVVPVPAAGESSIKAPDLSAFDGRRGELVAAFRRELLANADDERRAGLIFPVSDLGRVVVQVTPIKQTAAIVEFAQYRDPPAYSTRLARAVLLAGHKDADDAALDLASAIPGLEGRPDILREARAGGRPMMIQCFEERRWFVHPIPHVLGDAAAVAFFEQFGAPFEVPVARKKQQVGG